MIGDTNARLGSKVGDIKKNDRYNWAISYESNYKFIIMNSIPPNTGIFTWHRNKSTAILDYVYVRYYSTDQYQLQIIPTTTISDHQMLYLNAKIFPTRRINNPQKIIIYAKWKFFINKRN